MYVALSVLLAAVCLAPGLAKVLGLPRMRQAAAHFGISWRSYQLIGVAELAAAAGVLAGLLWHVLGLAAASGMVLLLIGALVSHQRAGDRIKEAAPALVAFVIAAVYLAVPALH
jgi:uncharacterized membrane protein YphA (DoxX/SURF4 family)